MDKFFKSVGRAIKSKTVWGVLAGAVGWLVQQPDISVTEITQAVGAVITAAGVRDAFRKAGEGTGDVNGNGR